MSHDLVEAVFEMLTKTEDRGKLKSQSFLFSKIKQFILRWVFFKSSLLCIVLYFLTLKKEHSFIIRVNII